MRFPEAKSLFPTMITCTTTNNVQNDKYILISKRWLLKAGSGKTNIQIEVISYLAHLVQRYIAVHMFASAPILPPPKPFLPSGNLAWQSHLKSEKYC